MLDIECFTFLNKALESPLAPIVVFATNRGVCQVRGTSIKSPHGIPMDLLDRLMIIRTTPYTVKEMREILKIRANVEDISITEQGLTRISALAKDTSLRYAIQLLTPCRFLAQSQHLPAVTPEIIDSIIDLFIDAKTSSKRLEQQSSSFLT